MWGDWIYWTDDAGEIKQSTIADGTTTTIGFGALGAPMIDITGVYWFASSQPNTIELRREQAGRIDVLETRPTGGRPFGVPAAMGPAFVYWSEEEEDPPRPDGGGPASNARLLATPKNGEASTVLADADLLTFEIVVGGGWVYFRTVEDGLVGSFHLRRVPVGGGTVEDLPFGTEQFQRMDANDTYLYLATTKTLERWPHTGGAPEAVQGSVSVFAVDDSVIYFAPWGSTDIMRQEDHGTPVAVAGLQRSVSALRVRDGELYWIAGNSIRTAHARLP